MTSYGLLTVGGLISFVFGSLMLFDAPIPDMRVSLAVVLPTALVIAGVTAFLLTRVLRAHRLRPITGAEGLIGEVGTALADIDPTGKVFVHGEYWDARSASGADRLRRAGAGRGGRLEADRRRARDGCGRRESMMQYPRIRSRARDLRAWCS